MLKQLAPRIQHILPLFLLSLTSCFRAEPLMDRIDPQWVELETNLLDRGQVYYRLSSNRVVGFNAIGDWDLAFECVASSFYIKMNSGRGMGVYNTRELEFGRKFKDLDYAWSYDDPGGDPALGAIGKWGDFNYSNPQSFEHVYILHMGFDQAGNSLGLKKFKIHGFSDNHYFVQFADLDNENNHTVFVPKRKEYNYAFLSLKGKGAVVDVEPPKKEWDLCFSPYYDTLYTENPYSLKLSGETGISEGILTNRAGTMSAIVRGADFNQLNYFHLNGLEMQRNANAIGNKWYSWDTTSRTFRMESESIYVLKDQSGQFYAVEILSFEKMGPGSGKLSFHLKNL